jgi:Flp pilus assembly pilin Flp
MPQKDWIQEKLLRSSYRLHAAMLSLKPGALGRNTSGQDMIEYALLAAAIAVLVAGFLPQDIMPAVSNIFSKISSVIARSPS